MVKASEFKNVCKAVNDRQLESLKKEIIEILKKQDEKDVKKAIDYFNSQEGHYTHLEKSLISGKWIQKAGYGVGTVRIWKGKKYKKIAPGKWARVFDKEGRGTNIAIGKLIAKVQKIDNVEDLMAFVMENKQRFVDENGIDLPVLDKLRAAVDAKNNGGMGSKGTSKPAESTTTAELINKNKDKIEKYGIDIYKDEISNTTPKALKNMDEKELKDFINFTEYLKNENEKIHDNAQNQNEKNKAWMSAAHSEQLNRMAKNRLKAVIAQNEPIKNFNTEVANSVDIENFKKEIDDSYNSEFRVASRLSEGDTDYSEGAIKFDKLVKNDKGAKDFIEKISNTNVDEIDSSLYKTVVMDLLEKKGFFEESEAEKTQNRSEAMKGNKNAKKLFTSEDGAEDYFKTIVSPFEFNIGEAKVRMEIREKTNLPPDVSQIPFDLVVVRDNGSTVVSHPKSYDDAYDEILETIRGENSSLSTEWPDMNGKFVRLHNRYAMDSLKALPKEDKYGNKVDDFIDEEIKNKAGSFKKNTKELQNELMSLSKQRNENLDEIKRLNADLGKINQDKYNDEARGNPTTEYDKKLKEINNKIDNLLDGNADIEKRGNDIVKELDKLEKEPEKKNEPKTVKTSSVNLGVTADGKDIKVTKSTDAKKKIGIAKATLEDDKFIVPATKELDDTIKAMEKFFKDVDANNRIMLKGFGVVDGFLCATDGRQAVRIKIDGLDNSVGDCVKIRKEGNNYIIEQDDLSTTWEETTDDWSRGYKQMKKVTRTADRKTQKYPNVSRVIPDNATETMDLDTAALKDVIKQLKKEKFLSASTVRSDANHYLPVIIQDGNITIDGKTIGTIPDKEIDKEMAWDFRFVENALNMGANSFNYSPEKMEEAPYMPLVASTNIGDTVFMSAEPMAKMTSYDKDTDKVVQIDKLTQHRENMAEQQKKDESKRNAMYSTNKEYFDVIIDSVKRSIKPDFSEKMIEKIKNMGVKDLKNLYNQAKVDIDDLMGKKDFYANTFSSYTNKHYDVSPKVLIAQNYALKQYPELVTEIEKQLEAKGEKVKKSLFDDFIVDMFVEEDEEEEPEEENESLFNDYSAEQPELFNSTEMMVSEAFNRCNCL